jgi:predicted DNA-binding transcriptional regulator AlpA
MKQDDRLLKIEEVAAMLACSKVHVRRLKEAGLLVPINIGLGRACWRWQPSTVERFAKDGKRG